MQMVSQGSKVDDFTRFVDEHEARLRESLIAACGTAGREAAADALVVGWEKWDRVRDMENPVGYLYRVGLNSARRARSSRRVVFHEVETSRLPDVEPKLPTALGRLSERQRTVVVLVHCFQWTFSEVADVLGLGKTTVQKHLERGMATLRREIGGVA